MSLGLAIKWFFKILSQGEAAFREAPGVAAATPAAEGAAAAQAPAPVVAPPAAPKPAFQASTEPAIQMLALLQKEGRLLDFLMEDVSGFSDAEIGAAVRDIHRGCRKALEAQCRLRRVVPEEEGAAITVPAGFDPSAIALEGAVSGAPPFRGAVLHRGWYVEEIKLPTVPAAADPRVVAPAQVEVSGR